MCELKNKINNISNINITNNESLKVLNDDIQKKMGSININTLKKYEDKNNIISSSNTQSSFTSNNNNNSIIDKNDNINNYKSSSIYLSSKHNSPNKRKLFNLYFLESMNNINNLNNIHNILEENKQMNDNCLICNEKLTKEEFDNNFVECFHGFCDDCYFNYFREKINNNDIEKIKCPEKNCNNIIYNDFIEKKIIKDISLLEKYKKLKEKNQLMYDPNIKFCPYPDCDSYAKKGKNKFVICKNGHKFCFNCLKNWHENKSCVEDKHLEILKKTNNVKRCPKCKCFIEKDVGCNHITCFICKYHFCWLCMKEYHYDHYESGNCNGLQYTDNSCFSNIICRILYQILTKLKMFIICTFFLPIYLIFSIINKIYVKFDINSKPCEILFTLYIILLFLPWALSLISISCFISLLMTIFSPIENKIYAFLGIEK